MSNNAKGWIRSFNTDMFDTILFDFDYTLADSAKGVVECMNFAFDRLGLPLTPPDDICKTIGLTLPEAFRVLVGDGHDDKTQEFFDLFVEHADRVMVDLTVLFPEVRPMVEELRNREIGLGIVSTKYRYRIETILEREQLLDSFSVIIGGNDVTEQKPCPEGLLKAVGRFDGSVSRALYVGDSVVDAEAASRAGIPFVAVLSGTTRQEEFHNYDVYRILPGLSTLPGIVTERK